MLARSLLCDGAPAFEDAAGLEHLGEAETFELWHHAGAALRRISPLYCYAAWQEWHAALVLGAVENWSAALALAGCVDVAFGHTTVRVTERPERYFGGALADMTDGQWMVYRAACEAVAKRTGKR